ncbi:MAG: cupin domain-containing protein [Verrucomicrobiales bacterium]|nr:cupin domain-containing protein [Verrucomicrobiales bacterium]
MNKSLYGILFAFLFVGCASPKYATSVKSTQLAKSTKSWDGQKLPPYERGTPEVTILRITVPPKHTLPMHRHPGINAGVLLKGELTVTTKSGKVLRLKPNDSIIEVVDTWHYGRNDGNVPAEIIVFYAGIEGESITIKKSGH